MTTITRLHLLSLIALILICIIPTSSLFASAVPVDKKASHFQQKKKKKWHRKKGKKALHKRLKTTADFHQVFPWLVLGWYLLFTALLIIGLVLPITALWIVAIIGLGLPLLAALIFGLWILIDLNSAAF